MPRKPSILRRAGIRLPETARPGFAKLSAEEQAAAARRDAEYFARSLRALARERRRLDRGRSLKALEQRLELVELELAWVLAHLGLRDDADGEHTGAERTDPA